MAIKHNCSSFVNIRILNFQRNIFQLLTTRSVSTNIFSVGKIILRELQDLYGNVFGTVSKVLAIQEDKTTSKS